MSEAIPICHELLWPTLRAVRDLGGSTRIAEIDKQVIDAQGFTEEQQAVPHGNGRQSETEYRLAWARTNLKGVGALVNSSRGVRNALAAKRREVGATELLDEEDEEVTEGAWKDELIARLLALDPAAFERVAQRLLREAGFSNVTVTGRSGDGGIDGVGLYRPTLVSFPVLFQCKRYRGGRLGRLRPGLPGCDGRPGREGLADHDR